MPEIPTHTSSVQRRKKSLLVTCPSYARISDSARKAVTIDEVIRKFLELTIPLSVVQLITIYGLHTFLILNHAGFRDTLEDVFDWNLKLPCGRTGQSKPFPVPERITLNNVYRAGISSWFNIGGLESYFQPDFKRLVVLLGPEQNSKSQQLPRSYTPTIDSIRSSAASSPHSSVGRQLNTCHYYALITSIFY